jgi:5-methylcytosine-specific restriction endonuclease McrA
MDDALTKEQQIELAWAQHLARRCPLAAAVRERLGEAQNWRCCYCGIRMEGTGTDWDAPTFEHIVPRAKGGLDEIDNLAISCRLCNERRANGDTQ